MRTALTTLVVAVVLGACDQAQGPNVPSPAALAGDWTATYDETLRRCDFRTGSCVTYSVHGTGQLTFTVTRDSVSGTYQNLVGGVPSGQVYPIVGFFMTGDGNFSFGFAGLACRWSGTLPSEPITAVDGAVSCPSGGGHWSAIRAGS